MYNYYWPHNQYRDFSLIMARPTSVRAFDVNDLAHVSLCMLFTIFLVNLLHFLATHSVLSGCSAFWPFYCNYFCKQSENALQRSVDLLIILYFLCHTKLRAVRETQQSLQSYPGGDQWFPQFPGYPSWLKSLGSKLRLLWLFWKLFSKSFYGEVY